MQKVNLLSHIEVTRKRFTELVSTLSEEQLNAIPENFKNNIAWNFAHVIATQQLLTNGLAEVPFVAPQSFIDSYRKGSVPEEHVSFQELESFMSLSDESLSTLHEGIKNQVYQKFTPYTTSYGVQLNTLEEALRFIPIHEAMHLGMCMTRLKQAE